MHPNYEEALSLLSNYLKKMRKRLKTMDQIKISTSNKKIIEYLQNIYAELKQKVDIYTQTHEDQDFDNASHLLEAIYPSFVINYNELCYPEDIRHLCNTFNDLKVKLKAFNNHHSLSHSQYTKLQNMKKICLNIENKIKIYQVSHEKIDFEMALNTIQHLSPQFFLYYKDLIN